MSTMRTLVGSHVSVVFVCLNSCVVNFSSNAPYLICLCLLILHPRSVNHSKMDDNVGVFYDNGARLILGAVVMLVWDNILRETSHLKFTTNFHFNLELTREKFELNMAVVRGVAS